MGARLGADSIRAGTIACLVSAALVVTLMLVYYGVFGLIADVALVLNVVLILGIADAARRHAHALPGSPGSC